VLERGAGAWLFGRYVSGEIELYTQNTPVVTLNMNMKTGWGGTIEHPSRCYAERATTFSPMGDGLKAIIHIVDIIKKHKSKKPLSSDSEKTKRNTS